MRATHAIVFVTFLVAVGYCGHTATNNAATAAATKPTVTTATTQPKNNSAENVRRMFRENHRADDNARNFFFRNMLRTAGERCDRVTRATMTASGTWRVNCEPTSMFVFHFNKLGEPTAASRLY